MKNIPILSRLKNYFKNLLFPSPIAKKKDLILKYVWLAIALALLVSGSIVGSLSATVHKGDFFTWFLVFFFMLSWVCAIPFFVKILFYAIRSAARYGKRLQYEQTELSKVGQVDSTSVYEVRKTKKNLSGWFGVVAAIAVSFVLVFPLGFVGLFALIFKTVLTIKMLVKYYSAKKNEKTERAQTQSQAENTEMESKA